MDTPQATLRTMDRWLLRALIACLCIALLSWSFSEIVYERRDTYWKGPVYDRLENNAETPEYEREEPESTESVDHFQTGAVSSVEAIPPKDELSVPKMFSKEEARQWLDSGR